MSATRWLKWCKWIGLPPRAATLLALGLLALAPVSVPADFTLPSGQEFLTGTVSTNQGNVSAEAYFVLGNGTITLYVANLESGANSQGQAISGIQFTVSTPPDTALSVSSVAGNLGDLPLTNTTYQTINAAPVKQGQTTLETAENWAAISVNNVTNLGSGTPTSLILGPNIAFSGNGGDNFNPYFQSTATTAFSAGDTLANGAAVVFVLNAPGVTANSTIGNVVFNFGTSPNEATANGLPSPNPVPAPPSAVLLGIGVFALLGFMTVRRLRCTPVAA